MDFVAASMLLALIVLEKSMGMTVMATRSEEKSE